jgi:hypothetical protein
VLEQGQRSALFGCDVFHSAELKTATGTLDLMPGLVRQVRDIVSCIGSSAQFCKSTTEFYYYIAATLKAYI